MSTKKQRKLDKKRKAKRQKDLRSRSEAPLAYSGSKYKTDELVPLIFATEAGILQAFLSSKRTLTDHDVRNALSGLIHAIRRGQFRTQEEIIDLGTPIIGDTSVLITWVVRGSWSEFFQSSPYPGRDKLIGVLRTILGSVDVWSTPAETSRGYLNYLGEFFEEVDQAVAASAGKVMGKVKAARTSSPMGNVVRVS